MLLRYIARRLLFSFFILVGVSIVAFVVIQLPPGDYLTSYIQDLQMRGTLVDQQMIDNLRRIYGLDEPMYMQYFKWMRNIFEGNFGVSFDLNKTVADAIAERLPLTIMISLATTFVVYLVAVPIGIYSAVHQYSIADFAATFLAFIGVATPNFILALILVWAGYSFFNISIGGLVSQEFIQQPMSWAKFLDILKHLPIPLIVIGLSGTAGTIRVLRAGVLDELRKQYVVTARAKGMAETRLIMKYPVRTAMNPIVSSMAWMLPNLVSGETIVSIVLGLPTIGPMLYRALISQDMFLAATCVLLLSFMTVIGMLISDILLGILDPRIRYD
jgi:peptide/nickel transport system permease protein